MKCNSNRIGFFFHYARHHSLHIHPIPFDAGHHHQRANRHWHRVLRLCHGAQCVCVAERENDMRTKFGKQSIEYDNEFTDKYDTADGNNATLSEYQWSFAHASSPHDRIAARSSQSYAADVFVADQP